MPGPRSVPKKIGIALAAVVGAIVVLVVLLLVLIDSGAVTKRAVDLVLPRLSAALGREVTLRGADLSVFPNPRVTLTGLTVAGRAGEPALVETESLDVEVRLWPLVRSLGKDLEVRAITLVRPSVNLVKAKDGTWNFEGLGAAGPAGAPAEPSKAPPKPAPPPESGGARVAVGLAKIEQAAIRVLDRTLGKDDAALALTLLDVEAHDVGPGLPLEARLAAALGAKAQNLRAQLSVAKLPAGVPQRPEDWPEVHGSLNLASLALDRVHALLPGDVGAIVRGGTATLDAKLSTAEGAYRVDGTGDLRDVRLRGQSSSGKFRAIATWSPAKPDAARLDVSDLALRGPGIDLGGKLSVETLPMRATFALAGPLLDLDAVMGILPDEPGKGAAPAAAAPEGEVVPETTRREIQSAAARGTIQVDKLRGGRLEATDVKARATLSRGTLTLDELSAAVFGGRVSGSGTTVSLAEKVPKWKLAANLDGVDLGQAMKAFAGQAPLLGKVNGKLDVNGTGTQWEELRNGLVGLAALDIKDGALTTTDLGDQVLGSVAKGLEALGKGGASKKVGGVAGGKTTFRELAGKFAVKDGFMRAQSPLKFGTPVGEVALGGGVGLDSRLDLQGTAAVPKKVLAEVVSGLPLPEKLDVPLTLGGTLSSPSVSVRADEAISSLAKGQAKAATEELRKKAEKEGSKQLKGVLDRFGK